MALVTLRLPVMCIFVILYLLFDYIRKQHLNTSTANCFSAYVALATVNIITEFIVEYLFLEITPVSQFAISFWHDSFILSIFGLYVILLLYVISLIELTDKKKRSFERRVIAVGCVVFTVVVILLPIEIVQTPFGNYAAGPKVYAFFVAAVFVLLMILCHYRISGELLSSKQQNLMRFVLLVTPCFMFWQLVIPFSIVSGICTTLLLIIMYMSMESAESYIYKKTNYFNSKGMDCILGDKHVAAKPFSIVLYALHTDIPDQERMDAALKDLSRHMSIYHQMETFMLTDRVVAFVEGRHFLSKNPVKEETLPKVSERFTGIQDFSALLRYPEDVADFDDIWKFVDRFILRHGDESAMQDAMTGTFNRNRYEADCVEFTEHLKTATCYIADINNLKLANDRFGHSAGDKMIRDMGKVLLNTFSSQSYVYRTGGDEFTIIYSGEQSFQSIYEKLQENCKEVNKHRSVPLSFAIGHGVYVAGKNTWDEAVEIADAEMYEDKLKNPLRRKTLAEIEAESLEKAKLQLKAQMKNGDIF